MEVEGAFRIFNRSEVLHNLRYTQYLGDGDSKAYKAVLESKPYKDVNIEKLECVGHVEKRMDLLNIQPGFYTCRALQEADHARIRKAEKAISRRTKEARIKNRQLKYRQEDDLADDPSNPQVMVLNILKNNLTSRARLCLLPPVGTLKTGPPHVLSRRVYPERRGTEFKAHWRTEWRSVVLSDESRFFLGASDGRVLVRRRPVQRLQLNYLRPRHTGPIPGIIVWGAISMTQTH
ncbi:transposable element Tc1 transposase [Trichonephila clavipes]|nr:transposable element Tc1 transposase [Trichonephila clavipes]